jgi:hypothetical protein
MIYYVALPFTATEGGLAPGQAVECPSGAAAPSLDEALARAGEALALHVEGMAEDGESIPPPSGFAEVIKDNPDAMTVLVPFPLTRTLQRG